MSVTIRIIAWLGVTSLCPLLSNHAYADAADSGSIFTGAVQPILSSKCMKCHGGVKKEGGISFLSKEGASARGKSGRLALVSGDPDASEIIARITHSDSDERMPPDEPLTASEVNVLREWIAAGSPWPQHWSLKPIRDIDPGRLDVSNKSWIRSPIDRFVLERLDSHGIAPSPEADKFTIIRRLHLDLLGLPPTPQAVDAFINDDSEAAYEKLIDQLLGSEHFGERWARHWLDQARYADSDGYEKDNPRPNAWRWRQWVIDSINSDMPFNQFTMEQIAGDLLPHSNPQHRLATAFHRQTLFNTEGGVDKEEDRTKRVIDRINTIGAVWLGTTVQCSQCHDHPYDPISQREFFGLYSFFNNTDEANETVERISGARELIAQEKLALETLTAQRDEPFQQWVEETLAAIEQAEANTLTFHDVEVAETSTTSGTLLQVSEDKFLMYPTEIEADKDTYEISVNVVNNIEFTGIRLLAQPHEAFPNGGSGLADSGNYVLTRIEIAKLNEEDIEPFQFEKASASFHQKNFPPSGSIGTGHGWAIAPQVTKPQHAVFLLDQAANISPEETLKITLTQNYGGRHLIGKFKLQIITGRESNIKLPQNITQAFADVTNPEHSKLLKNFYLDKVDSVLDAKRKQITKLESEGMMNVRVVNERSKDRRKTLVFHRGDFLNPDKEQEVTAGTPNLFPPLAKTKNAGRMEFANWLMSPDNPRTARVTANTIWSHLFGRGLSTQMEDFGAQGEVPSYPYLLDWLAHYFIHDAKWSRKQLIREIVLSSTYRQASAHRLELADRDPENRLLYRQNRFRVEAEIIRDTHLTASGLLSRKVGGPSVFPPLPEEIAKLSYANNFKWATSKNDDRFRRGMYTFFKRTAPDPNLVMFDCPDSNVTQTGRDRSNTPIQALATLHNEVFVEAARAMALRLIQKRSTTEDRIKLLFRLCLSRTPAKAEAIAIEQLHQEAASYYEDEEADATSLAGKLPSQLSHIEVASWIATTRIVMNLDEFVTRE